MKNHRTSSVVGMIFEAAIWVMGPSTAICQTLAGIGAVMTYNLDEGTGFIQLQSVSTGPDFLAGVGQIVEQVQATNPPERMQAVARRILEVQPALVSLQEIAQWQNGAFDPTTGNCGPMALEFDMLRELQDALAAGGGHYQESGFARLLPQPRPHRA